MPRVEMTEVDQSVEPVSPDLQQAWLGRRRPGSCLGDDAVLAMKEWETVQAQLTPHHYTTEYCREEDPC